MKRLLTLLVAVVSATGLRAEGYQVNNLSTRQTGMGHVGTAMKLNSESIFFNPAATAFQDSKFDLSVGAAGILSYCTYTPSPTMENGFYSGNRPEWESDNKMSTPIYAYFNYKPSDRWAVGLGFFTPNGSSMNWGDDWPGANLVQEINLAAYTVQPTVSFKLCDRVSIGAGLMITWGNFDLSRSMLPVATGSATAAGGLQLAASKLQAQVDQLEQLPSTPEIAAQIAALNGYIGQANAGAGYFAANHAGEALVSARLEGSADVAVGVNAGIMWDINSEWSLGMSWRSRMNMKVGSGRAALSYVSPETQQYLTLLNALSTMAGGSEVIPGLDRGTFSAELPLPTTVTWGVSFRPAPKWEFAVDLQWVGWSAYEALNVEFNEKELGIDPIYSVKNYSNTLTFRFGGQYRACDWLTARMGMYVDESPVSSDYLNPETPSMTKVLLYGRSELPSPQVRLDRRGLLLRFVGRPRTDGFLSDLQLSGQHEARIDLFGQLQTPRPRPFVRCGIQFLSPPVVFAEKTLSLRSLPSDGRAPFFFGAARTAGRAARLHSSRDRTRVS